MKFKVGDKVVVTAGKDKGIKSEIVKVLPQENKVIVKDANMYTKHVKPMGERAGEKVRRERALPAANVAVLNDKDQPDRIGYRVTSDGRKERVYRKTGKTIESKVSKK